MRPEDWLVTCVNATIVAVLLRAAAAKLVAPAPTAAAIGELRAGRAPRPGWIKLLASFELAVAFAVPVPAFRLPVQAAVGLMAVGFTSLGALGVLRGSREPCGCFGTASTRPFGYVNVSIGLAFAGAAAVNVAASHLHDSRWVASTTALAAAGVCAAWLIATNRVSAREVFRNALSRSEVSA